MLKQRKNRIRQKAKLVLISSCVFAIISSVLLVIVVYGFPQMLQYRQQAKYLYENGIEVDAHIDSYFKNYAVNQYGTKYAGHFHIVYEYIDDNDCVYKDEYTDTVRCKTREDWDERELYIKQMIADGTTKKMLIADNGLCCLSVYKESLMGSTTLVIYIVLISISSVVLGLSIFGIVRQSKKLKLLKKSNDS